MARKKKDGQVDAPVAVDGNSPSPAVGKPAVADDAVVDDQTTRAFDMSAILTADAQALPLLNSSQSPPPLPSDGDADDGTQSQVIFLSDNHDVNTVLKSYYDHLLSNFYDQHTQNIVDDQLTLRGEVDSLVRELQQYKSFGHDQNTQNISTVNAKDTPQGLVEILNNLGRTPALAVPQVIKSPSLALDTLLTGVAADRLDICKAEIERVNLEIYAAIKHPYEDHSILVSRTELNGFGLSEQITQVYDLAAQLEQYRAFTPASLVSRDKLRRLRSDIGDLLAAQSASRSSISVTPPPVSTPSLVNPATPTPLSNPVVSAPLVAAVPFYQRWYNSGIAAIVGSYHAAAQSKFVAGTQNAFSYVRHPSKIGNTKAGQYVGSFFKRKPKVTTPAPVPTPAILTTHWYTGIFTGQKWKNIGNTYVAKPFSQYIGIPVANGYRATVKATKRQINDHPYRTGGIAAGAVLALAIGSYFYFRSPENVAQLPPPTGGDSAQVTSGNPDDLSGIPAAPCDKEELEKKVAQLEQANREFVSANKTLAEQNGTLLSAKADAVTALQAYQKSHPDGQPGQAPTVVCPPVVECPPVVVCPAPVVCPPVQVAPSCPADKTADLEKCVADLKQSQAGTAAILANPAIYLTVEARKQVVLDAFTAKADYLEQLCHENYQTAAPNPNGNKNPNGQQTKKPRYALLTPRLLGELKATCPYGDGFTIKGPVQQGVVYGRIRAAVAATDAQYLSDHHIRLSPADAAKADAVVQQYRIGKLGVRLTEQHLQFESDGLDNKYDADRVVTGLTLSCKNM